MNTNVESSTGGDIVVIADVTSVPTTRPSFPSEMTSFVILVVALPAGSVVPAMVNPFATEVELLNVSSGSVQWR